MKKARVPVPTEAELAAKARREQSHAWTRATIGVPLEDAIQRAVDLVRKLAPGDATIDVDPRRIWVRIERGWATEVRIDVRLRGGLDESAVNPDDPTLRAYVLTPEVEIGWSSTSRNVSAATTALAIYRTGVELAATVEHLLASLRPFEIRKSER